MRIISGKFKGRRFNPPTNITARPTTDFAKESLFNLIDNYMDLEQKVALDLFAGTGSISAELISRGCREVTSVEMSERQLGFMRKLSNDLQVNNWRISRIDVFRYLRTCNRSFDFVFADPPYQMEKLNEIPDSIFENRLLTPIGLFVLEHGRRNDFSNHPCFMEHRYYGNVHFSFFKSK